MHYALYVGEFADRLVANIAGVGAVWVCAWAIRRKGELDYPLDSTAKVVRWVAVVILMGIPANFPSLPINLRRVLDFSGIAFLAWPNFAYHLTRFLRSCKLLPNAGLPPPNPPSGQQDFGTSAPFRSPEPTIFGFTREGKDNKHEQAPTAKWK